MGVKWWSYLVSTPTLPLPLHGGGDTYAFASKFAPTKALIPTLSLQAVYRKCHTPLD